MLDSFQKNRVLKKLGALDGVGYAGQVLAHYAAGANI
jgi:hypothetical protein